MTSLQDVALFANAALITFELILAIIIANLARKYRLSPGDTEKQTRLQDFILPLLLVMTVVAFVASALNVVLGTF